MYKYEGELYNPTPDKMYLEQKIVELERFDTEISLSLPHSQKHIDAAAAYLNIRDANTITDIAVTLEEDIAILDQGRLVSISFCFPSGFIPAEKIGMNFFDMHLPVSDGERLRSASEKVSQLISKEGASFRRFVWTITSLPGLSQHPSLIKPEAASIEDLYFRTETQTTLGLSDGICLFFVKVEMTPLSQVWADDTMKNEIILSINSMTDAVLEYKNLFQVKKIVNQ